MKGSKMAASLTAKSTHGVRSSMAADVPSAWPGRAVVEEVKKWSGPKPISLIGSTGSIGTQVGHTNWSHVLILGLQWMDSYL